MIDTSAADVVSTLYVGYGCAESHQLHARMMCIDFDNASCPNS